MRSQSPSSRFLTGFDPLEPHVSRIEKPHSPESRPQQRIHDASPPVQPQSKEATSAEEESSVVSSVSQTFDKLRTIDLVAGRLSITLDPTLRILTPSEVCDMIFALTDKVCEAEMHCLIEVAKIIFRCGERSGFIEPRVEAPPRCLDVGPNRLETKQKKKTESRYRSSCQRPRSERETT